MLDWLDWDVQCNDYKVQTHDQFPCDLRVTFVLRIPYPLNLHVSEV